MKVGIVANPEKPGARMTVRKLMEVLIGHGLEPLLERRTARVIDHSGGLDGPELAAESDVIVVLGGDGTMLHAMDRLGGTSKPIAGINIGTLGFLTSCQDSEIERFADALKEGTYEISHRTLLAATVIRASGEERRFLALNEAVMARGQTGRLGGMKAKVNGELLNRYRADGLIVATPTGSTAYSLSAGGPLISPSAGVFVITPICPHTLSQRSLVLDDSVVVELMPDGVMDSPMSFTVDGRDCVALEENDRVIVGKAAHQLQLVRLKGGSFYGALRKKLNWRGG
ncbi:MAG: NAD(+)/NADH kinase [Verrucomicrobiales bacterium]